MQNSIFSEEFSVNHTSYDIIIYIFIQIKLWLKKVAKYLKNEECPLNFGHFKICVSKIPKP